MKLIFLVVSGMIAMAYGKMQNITVKGTTICNKKRLPDVTVELWEKDTLDPNDLLSKTTTNKDAEFTISGGEDEIGSIEPFLRITHSCNVKSPGCLRIAEYTIPKSRINGVYDMTYVILDIHNTVEKEKCP
uniref:Transthyretin-like family protein n=1 Tax=Heterorhabditis bacteriophora TaxID=37862 RepID=A0A1I7XJS1_HETBA